MSLQKYLLIILSVFMQIIPVVAKNEAYETDIQDQTEESNNDEEYNNDEEFNDNIKYLLVAAGVVTIGGLLYWYQSPLASMVMERFGDTINENGQVVITSQKAIVIMNNNQSLQNVNYRLRGPVVMEGGKIKSGILTDGSYFTANGVNYVVKS